MTAPLQRRLGLLDAVTVGAGSMIGAGVFSAWGPAADAAGTGVLIGLVVAAAVAFAGYARIATLGEEVRDPATIIPKAIPRALAGVLVVYAAVGITVLAAVPVAAIAASDAPLGLVLDVSRIGWLSPIVRVGAGIAALGVLLNLIPGVSRTVLAMARRHELPGWFGAVDNSRSLPQRAVAAVTAVVIALTATLDLRGAIGFSGVTILTYYAITNAACLTLPPGQRRWPRSIAVVGLVGCVTLAVMLPLAAILAGAGTLVVGIVIRALATAARHTDLVHKD